MKKEFKIGLVVITAILMLYWGGSYLSGNNILKKNNDYFAVYPKVDGLLISNEVRYQGFKVGRVSDIQYLSSADKWLVTFSISEESLKIKNKSLAYISSADILGTMILELDSVGNGDRLAIPNDTLIGVLKPDLQEAVDQRLKPLVFKIENLISSVDSVIGVVTMILDEKTRNNIKTSLERIPLAVQNILNATETTDSIVSQLERARIQDVINNVASISENFKNNNEALSHVIQNFESISDSLAKANVKATITKLNSVLSRTDSIMYQIESGKGSLGLLVNDPQLYNDLVYATTSLDFLLMDIRQNPKKYVRFSVFGGKSKDKPTNRDTVELKRLADPMIIKMIRDEFNRKLDSLDRVKK